MISLFKKSFNKSSKQIKSYKKSYSQSGEDVIIDFIFHTIGITNPSYLDIGAHHPYSINNTAIFYERGCRGINIEPDPELFNDFLVYRKDDINLNIGIADKKSTLEFYKMSVPTLNTFSKKEAESISKEGDFKIEKIIPIAVEPISDIIEKYHSGLYPDFLTLDAEGIDEMVIHSIDFEKNSPKVICVETLSFSPSGQGVKNSTLISFLEEKGYLLYADTYINSIFVQKELWYK